MNSVQEFKVSVDKIIVEILKDKNIADEFKDVLKESICEHYIGKFKDFIYVEIPKVTTISESTQDSLYDEFRKTFRSLLEKRLHELMSKNNKDEWEYTDYTIKIKMEFKRTYH